MSDTTTVWDPANGRGDWVLAGVALQADGDLETAVLISLFSDRVAADDDEIPDGTGDPRGWCLDDPQHPIGSRLWLLSRAKGPTDLVQRAQDYINEALQWLLDDGVVGRIDATAQWVPANRLNAVVVLHRDGQKPLTLSYSWVWKGVN